MTKSIFVAFGTTMLVGSAIARTWTSTDGAQTFEGDFIRYEKGSVTVKRSNGKEMTFKATMLSEADQKWIEEEVARRTEAESLTSAAIPTSLEGNLLKLNGKRFKKFEPSTPSKYYLLYFSVSW